MSLCTFCQLVVDATRREAKFTRGLRYCREPKSVINTIVVCRRHAVTSTHAISVRHTNDHNSVHLLIWTSRLARQRRASLHHDQTHESVSINFVNGKSQRIHRETTHAEATHDFTTMPDFGVSRVAVVNVQP
jgi:hypothetical protein